MIGKRYAITVCIPAYNRANFLPELLDSIFNQQFPDFNVLICEDHSPERPLIRKIAHEYAERYRGRLEYKENESNLGYDGNIRELIACSSGEYCFFMGNDDLMCEGALNRISSIIERVPNSGVIVRSYATFEEDPLVHEQVYRYFAEELVVKGGKQAVSLGFRRSVVIPGMVFHRDSAFALSTDEFDGTLLYQLYLSGMILTKRSVVFTPEIIALRRNGTPPDFGNSEAEKGKFVPQDQTSESSIHFMEGMLSIARYVELKSKIQVFNPILSYIGHYSLPILSIQAGRPIVDFIKYGIQLGKLGLWRSPLFHVYFFSLIVFGPDHIDRLVKAIKGRVGYTPFFGVSSRKK